MDSNDLETERGITILAKNTAIEWQGHAHQHRRHPGHADFGGEVERVLSMVDSVLLLVDAVEGPMPQTRFVTQKAFALGLKPIVVINKVDRPGARPDWVLDQTFDLFDRLGATDEQLDFPVDLRLGAARLGRRSKPATSAPTWRRCSTRSSSTCRRRRSTGRAAADADQHARLLDYVGRIGIGRINRGTSSPSRTSRSSQRDGDAVNGTRHEVLSFQGLERQRSTEAGPATSSLVTGIEDLSIADTLTDLERPEGCRCCTVDEPTITMTFRVNNSPFAGREGKYVTSRQIRDRLERELHNVALSVEDTDDADMFKVSGRGELHLAILIENMRREGYELAVSQPARDHHESRRRALRADRAAHRRHRRPVPGRRHGGARRAPRRADNMEPDGRGRVRLEYLIPARGLIGFQTEFLNLTRGTGLLFHVFDDYGPCKGEIAGAERRAHLQDHGEAVAYALCKLQERGRCSSAGRRSTKAWSSASTPATTTSSSIRRGKKLTNIRASGKATRSCSRRRSRSRWSTRSSSSTTTSSSRSRRSRSACASAT